MIYKDIEKYKEYQRQYRATHKEEAKQYTKEWQSKNRERVNLQSKKTYQKRKEIRKEQRQLPENKERARAWHIGYYYGLTTNQYNELLNQQHNTCAICKTSEPGGKGWHVDHDHKTEKVRGLLCGQCNTGLGKFKDNVELLEEAARYLKCNT